MARKKRKKTKKATEPKVAKSETAVAEDEPSSDSPPQDVENEANDPADEPGVESGSDDAKTGPEEAPSEKPGPAGKLDWDDDESGDSDDSDEDDRGLAGESLAQSQLAADLEDRDARFNRLLAVLVGFGGEKPEGQIPDAHLMHELLTKAKEITIAVASGGLHPESDAHARAVGELKRAGSRLLHRIREIAEQPNLPPPAWLLRQEEN